MKELISAEIVNLRGADHRNDPSSPAAKTPATTIELEVQLFCELDDPLLGTWIHTRTIIQRPRHGGVADIEHSGNVTDRHVLLHLYIRPILVICLHTCVTLK